MDEPLYPRILHRAFQRQEVFCMDKDLSMKLYKKLRISLDAYATGHGLLQNEAFYRIEIDKIHRASKQSGKFYTCLE
ncbi:MAG: hypothetical protein A2Y38_01925 [Spirochaetes bacterium GWB1_59_5]|nr:MAG: hypothetical protein A2Y38_01925 [Spirochaetes bacterium GWB1_59_5]